MISIYSRDPREVGTYGIAEAARYLALKRSTLRSWVLGRSPAESEPPSLPLLELPDPGEPLLSFTNLVEAYVLAALRRRHGLKMRKVRKALLYLRQELGLRHPLATERLESDGTSLFLQRFGQLIDLPESGQLAIEPVLRPYLRRIERDETGLAARLFPLRRMSDAAHAPKSVVIDPCIAFGKPVLTGTGVPTAVIFQRFDAGESIAELAEDYGFPPSQIEEAIRYELRYEPAA